MDHQTFTEGRWVTPEEAAQKDAFVAYFDRILDEASKTGVDATLSDLIKEESPWRPFVDGYMESNQGCNTATCSTLDYSRNLGIGEELYVTDGYGSLIAKLAEGLPVELETEVNRVDWSGEGVKIRSSKGEISCKSVIITVSTGVLAANQIEFEPALPTKWRYAIDSLPMGNLAAVAIQFDQDIYGDFRGNAFTYFEEPGMTINMVTGIDNHRMVAAYFGGPHADTVEAMSDDEAHDFVLDRLEKVFGSTIRDHVATSLCTRWRSDPHIRGSYACALPGRADVRGDLASTLGNRIIFAGEATSKAHYAWAHGAHLASSCCSMFHTFGSVREMYD
jgi:monoamine oxidase